MAKELAIVLNNGSLNSAVVTALAAQRYRPILVYVESAAEGSSRSHAAYDQQVDHFKPYREHTIRMPFLALLQPQSTAAAHALDSRQSSLLAPRLTDLLPIVSIGLRLAVYYQAAAVYVGLRVGSGPNELTAAAEFIQIFNELIQLPCHQPELEMTAPLLELEPWQVVDVGYQVSAPFDRTWSCLEEKGDPCLACTNCRARDAAFQQAGKLDPLRMLAKKS
jgi:7-cyano-7-deazaguanine synthase in queuosine biosynthesis